MKNRLIRTVLLCVMSCALFAPILAMNTAMDTDTQAMVAAVTQVAQQETNPVSFQQDGGNKPQTQSTVPKASPGVLSKAGGELTSIFGFAWGCASWPFRFAGNDIAQSSMPVKKSLMWAFIAFSAGCIAKQGYELRDIDIKIGHSEADTASGEGFLFGSWKYDTDNYKTAADIFKHRKDVKQALWNEVRQPGSRIHILGANALRVKPEQVTKEHLAKALKKEKIKLQAYLKAISYLTDLPKKILELARTSSGLEGGNSYVWYQEAAFHQDALNYLKTLDGSGLEQFHADLAAKYTSYASYAKRVFFMAPGWSFWRVDHWRWGCWYDKASALYWKVYTRYLRTRALYDVIISDTTIVKQPILQQLLNIINDMIAHQNNVYGDINIKLLQYGRLRDATCILTAALVDYNGKQDITESLNNVSQQFCSMNTYFDQQKQGNPQNDPVVTYLNSAKVTVENLIKKEKTK